MAIASFHKTEIKAARSDFSSICRSSKTLALDRPPTSTVDENFYSRNRSVSLKIEEFMQNHIRDLSEKVTFWSFVIYNKRSSHKTSFLARSWCSGGGEREGESSEKILKANLLEIHGNIKTHNGRLPGRPW